MTQHSRRTSVPCVVPTWPAYVTNEDGQWWVRLDREHDAREFIERWEGGLIDLHRVGRRVMVRDPDLLEEEGLLIADHWHEHDDAAVYVEFEAIA